MFIFLSCIGVRIFSPLDRHTPLPAGAWRAITFPCEVLRIVLPAESAFSVLLCAQSTLSRPVCWPSYCCISNTSIMCLHQKVRIIMPRKCALIPALCCQNVLCSLSLLRILDLSAADVNSVILCSFAVYLHGHTQTFLVYTLSEQFEWNCSFFIDLLLYLAKNTFYLPQQMTVYNGGVTFVNTITILAMFYINFYSTTSGWNKNEKHNYTQA